MFGKKEQICLSFFQLLLSGTLHILARMKINRYKCSFTATGNSLYNTQGGRTSCLPFINVVIWFILGNFICVLSSRKKVSEEDWWFPQTSVSSISNDTLFALIASLACDYNIVSTSIVYVMSFRHHTLWNIYNHFFSVLLHVFFVLILNWLFCADSQLASCWSSCTLKTTGNNLLVYE